MLIININRRRIQYSAIIEFKIKKKKRFSTLLFLLRLLRITRPGFSLAQWTNRSITMDLLMTTQARFHRRRLLPAMIIFFFLIRLRSWHIFKAFDKQKSQKRKKRISFEINSTKAPHVHKIRPERWCWWSRMRRCRYGTRSGLFVFIRHQT